MLSFDAPDSRPLSMMSPNAVMADACDCEFLSRKVLLTIIEGTFDSRSCSSLVVPSSHSTWTACSEAVVTDARGASASGSDTGGAGGAGGAAGRGMGGAGEVIVGANDAAGGGALLATTAARSGRADALAEGRVADTGWGAKDGMLPSSGKDLGIGCCTALRLVAVTGAAGSAAGAARTGGIRGANDACSRSKALMPA